MYLNSLLATLNSRETLSAKFNELTEGTMGISNIPRRFFAKRSDSSGSRTADFGTVNFGSGGGSGPVGPEMRGPEAEPLPQVCCRMIFWIPATERSL